MGNNMIIGYVICWPNCVRGCRCLCYHSSMAFDDKVLGQRQPRLFPQLKCCVLNKVLAQRQQCICTRRVARPARSRSPRRFLQRTFDGLTVEDEDVPDLAWYNRSVANSRITRPPPFEGPRRRQLSIYVALENGALERGLRYSRRNFVRKLMELQV